MARAARQRSPFSPADADWLDKVQLLQVRLGAADRDEHVAALSAGAGGEPLQLAHLVAAECQPRGDVVALGPDLDAQLTREALQAVDG